MLIVCDTSPLRYLVEVEAIEALPKLYGEILTTPQVMTELRLEHFPQPVRVWAETPPGWLQVESPKVQLFATLGAGESSALSLAHERGADLVLIDERVGTANARGVGLNTVGTLAVLHNAGLEGLIDYPNSIERLIRHTAFRHTRSLIEQVTTAFQRAQRERTQERSREQGREA